MTYDATTTLRRIRGAGPCEDGWRKLLGHLGKTAADEEPLHLMTVLNSNGLEDALWVLSRAMPDDRLARHYQAEIAESVLPIFEAKRPDDHRIRDQIAMHRNDDATDTERRAATDAASDAASDAATDAARAAALAAATDVAFSAAWAAARASVRAAATDAARAAALAAARDDQERILRQMIGGAA